MIPRRGGLETLILETLAEGKIGASEVKTGWRFHKFEG
jgi:hypothetical protein